jgi:hypothetical protein
MVFDTLLKKYFTSLALLAVESTCFFCDFADEEDEADLTAGIFFLGEALAAGVLSLLARPLGCATATVTLRLGLQKSGT